MGLPGPTAIAPAAARARVPGVAEMGDQREHSTVLRVQVASHVRELCGLAGAMFGVRAPEVDAALLDLVVVVDARAAMDPQLVEDGVERLIVELELACERELVLGPAGDGVVHALELTGVRVVALEKELVRAPVGVGAQHERE